MNTLPTYKELEQRIKELERAESEHMKPECETRENEERFRLALRGGDLGYWDYYPDSGEAFFDEKWLAMLGYRKGDIEENVQIWSDLIHPDDRPGVLQKLQEHFDNQDVRYEVEMRLRAQPGGYRWILGMGEVLARDEMGNPLRMCGTHLDITERKQTEETLRENENRLRTIVEGTHALLANVDANGYFTYVNDATVRATGCSCSEELIGKSYLYFIHPKDRQRVLDTFINQVNTHQTSIIQEFRIIDAKGNVKWFSFLSTLSIKDGQFVGQSGVAQEITERKRIENELRESEMMNRTLLEGSPVCSKIIDLDFKLQYMSTAGRKGLKITDITPYYGKSFPPDFYPEWIRTSLTKKLKIAMNGEISNVEAPVIDMEGNEVWFFTTFVPIFDSENRVKYVIASSVDINERKQSEDKLQKSEEKLRSIIEHAHEFFYVHNTDHEITYISPTSEEVLGYTPQEMMINWTNLLTDNPINQKGVKVTEKAFTTGQRQDPYYLELKKKDGNHVMVEINESPIKDSQGNVLGITGAGKDVTERVRNEQALKDARDKLELRVEERTRELSKTNNKLLREIRERKEVEEALRVNEKELRLQTDRLAETNTALKVLLEHRDEEKTNLEENILSNVDKLAMPYLDKLATYIPNGHAKAYLDIIKTNLKDLVSPFVGTLSSKYLNLTPAEIQLSDFIRNGLTNKEIASQLNVSLETVSFHRKNIRKKLGLTNKKTNLRSYLQRLTD